MEAGNFYKWYNIMLILDDYGRFALDELYYINNDEEKTCHNKVVLSKKRIQAYQEERAKMFVELQRMDISELCNLTNLL